MGNHSELMPSTPQQDVCGQGANGSQHEAASSGKSKGHEKPFDSKFLVGPYSLGKQIGQGQFGVVQEGVHCETGRKVAIKKVSKQLMEVEEIRLQRQLDHEHVVKVHDVIEVGDDVHIVADCVSGGDLFDYLAGQVHLKEDEARRLFQQIIRGVDHCHQRMIVHRDLKPENILLDENKNAKIADFGFAAEMLPGEFLTESCGSPNYAAPELLYKGCRYRGPEIDVWSCGVVLYALLTSRLPFDAATIPELFAIITKCRYRVPSHVSPDAKDLLSRMLRVDPKQRISIAEIQKHKWFIGGTAQKAAATERPAESCKIFDPAPSTGETAPKVATKAEQPSHPTTVQRNRTNMEASVVINAEAAVQGMPLLHAMSCAASAELQPPTWVTC